MADLDPKESVGWDLLVIPIKFWLRDIITSTHLRIEVGKTCPDCTESPHLPLILEFHPEVWILCSVKVVGRVHFGLPLVLQLVPLILLVLCLPAGEGGLLAD